METKGNIKESFKQETPIITITGEISSSTAQRVDEEVDYFKYYFDKKFVPLKERVLILRLIDSPGGSISAGGAIIDKLRDSGFTINVEVYGMCASMAAVILACGATKGHRRAAKHSEIMIHQPLGGASGQASDIIIAAKHIERIRNQLYIELSEATGRNYEEIEKYCDRDTVFVAQEALEFGLIDEII